MRLDAGSEGKAEVARYQARLSVLASADPRDRVDPRLRQILPGAFDLGNGYAGLPKEIGERVKALARACLFRSGRPVVRRRSGIRASTGSIGPRSRVMCRNPTAGFSMAPGHRGANDGTLMETSRIAGADSPSGSL